MNPAGMLLDRREFDAETLVAEHPPVWHDRNKRVVYEIACPPGCTHAGRLAYTRWRAMPLPDRVAAGEAVARAESREDVYDYVPVAEASGAVEWHVNFADPTLFVAYGGPLFAQDEMQVTEHPILGALREKLTAARVSARTEEDGRPTPVLVTGAQRRCRIDTAASDHWPYGLYGNAFAAAPAEVIRAATSRVDPPTVTNIIAMAAPAGGYGRYTEGDIEGILTTAFTGFHAAVLESGEAPVVVHTGFWGCGAFGGNRVLMALLQIIAADMAGVGRLVFHTFDRAGTAAFDSAAGVVADSLAGRPMETGGLVARIASLGFVWGESDGN